MNFQRKTHLGTDFFVVDSWEESGYAHGFFGRSFNARTQGKEFLAFLESRHAVTIDRLQLLQQVHGSEFRRPEDLEGKCPSSNEADAWLVREATLGGSGRPLTAVGILTADCSPVIIRSRTGRRSALLHCGWRGSVLELLPKMLGELCGEGASAQDLELAIGPCAQACCYEISKDFLGDVSKLNPRIRPEIESRNGAFYYDNAALLKQQALAFGVPVEQIAVSSNCTICESEFFSHRREKQQAGRQLSYLLVTRPF